MKRSFLAVVVCIACLAVGSCDQNKQAGKNTGSNAAQTASNADAATPRELTPLLNAIATRQRDIERLALLTLLRVRLQQITSADVEARFDADLCALLQGGDSAPRQLARDLKESIHHYLDRVEDLARDKPNWPKDKPANIYAGMAAVKLAMLRKDLDNALNAGRVPIASLREVERVVAWAGGYADGLPASLPSDFAKYDALIERAAPILMPVNRVERPGSGASATSTPTPTTGVAAGTHGRIAGPNSKTPASAMSGSSSHTVVARGIWLLRGMPDHLCKTERWSDGTIVVTTSKGQQGRGRMLGDRTFTVDLPYAKNVVGKISADGRRIDWPNGSFWTLTKMEPGQQPPAR